MGAVGASLGAITTGDIGSLTNALGNLGGSAPQILTDVLGGRLPLSGIDIGGFGALGGLDFDLALASTFMSTAAAFLECDPKPECPIDNKYNFDGGGSNTDSDKINTNNIVDKVKEAVPPLPVRTTNLQGDIGFKPNFDIPKFPGGLEGV